jgi:hypothetical protein
MFTPTKTSIPIPTASTSYLPIVSPLPIDTHGEKYIKISIGIAFTILILAAAGIDWVIRRRWRGGGGRSVNQNQMGDLRDVGDLGGGSGNESPNTKMERRGVVGGSGDGNRKGDGGEVGAERVA